MTVEHLHILGICRAGAASPCSGWGTFTWLPSILDLGNSEGLHFIYSPDWHRLLRSQGQLNGTPSCKSMLACTFEVQNPIQSQAEHIEFTLPVNLNLISRYCSRLRYASLRKLHRDKYQGIRTAACAPVPDSYHDIGTSLSNCMRRQHARAHCRAHGCQ